ncbi:hypothetical protein TL16_g09207 [Triparma laevis f. inornata]|uniref:Uncharacterized protein n=1 Tax=Triparma laevis f. inornata TaxID=1714386 RepID=A0A9W7B1T3_9STRA|nr:hypothetical protein TL16_g09207 [Triparma laevis f. inornata]
MFKVVYVPHFIKCPFEHNKCSDGDVDGWSLYHLVDHFVAGYLFPHKRWECAFVFFQSLLCETGELIGGERARFIVDPGANLLGYILGHYANKLIRSVPDQQPESNPSSGEEAVILLANSRLELV